MGASRSRAKYAVPETDADAVVSSRYASSEGAKQHQPTLQPPRGERPRHSGPPRQRQRRQLSKTTAKRRNNALASSSSSAPSNFPAVHSGPTTSHPEVRPEWAVPKFNRWAAHAQEQNDGNPAFRAKKSLTAVLDLAETHARRYAHDRLLSPRTLFREVFDKPLNRVTDRECFLVDTFVSERKRIWRVQEKAACRLQCYWRVCQARALLGEKRDEKQLQRELRMADRRRAHDMTISERLLREGRKSVAAEAERVRLQREQAAEAAVAKRQEESWIAGFVAAGGIKTIAKGEFSREGAQQLQAPDHLPEEFVSDRRYTVLCHVLARLAEAGEMRWAWQGVRMRESFRTWRIETARMRFHITAKLWHMQGWFDRWRDHITRRRRVHGLLDRIMANLFVERTQLAFHRWRLHTRRRFEMVRVPGDRFPLTGEARVLCEGGRLTPRSAVLTNPRDLATMTWRMSDDGTGKGAGLTGVVTRLVKKRVRPGAYTSAASAGHFYIHRYGKDGGGLMI